MGHMLSFLPGKLRATDLFALRKISICIVTYRPWRYGGLGNSIPSSLWRELRLSTIVVLPLGAGMRSSVNSNVFAVHHRCRLQVEQRVHDFRDLDQSRNRAEFFE